MQTNRIWLIEWNNVDHNFMNRIHWILPCQHAEIAYYLHKNRQKKLWLSCDADDQAAFHSLLFSRNPHQNIVGFWTESRYTGPRHCSTWDRLKKSSSRRAKSLQLSSVWNTCNVNTGTSLCLSLQLRDSICQQLLFACSANKRFNWHTLMSFDTLVHLFAGG